MRFLAFSPLCAQTLCGIFFLPGGWVQDEGWIRLFLECYWIVGGVCEAGRNGMWRCGGFVWSLSQVYHQITFSPIFFSQFLEWKYTICVSKIKGLPMIAESKKTNHLTFPEASLETNQSKQIIQSLYNCWNYEENRVFCKLNSWGALGGVFNCLHFSFIM